MAFAQDAPPIIGGNVYGGGNQAKVGGSTTVQVKSGDINKVFGGARMADVGGNTYVNIDGENATGYTVINYVYGGNDISGTIGTAQAVGETLPPELVGNEDGVDITWNTYVHLSSKTESAAVYYTQAECDEYNTTNSLSSGDEGYRTPSDIKTPAVVPEKTYIGQLFAGGNGDYFYDSTTAAGKTTHSIYFKEGDTTPIATMVTDPGETGFNVPELAKTYLDIQGGSIVYAYGGGNKATVTEQNVIHLDNPTQVVNHIFVNSTTRIEDKTATEASGSLVDLLTATRFKDGMGINMGFSHPSSDAFQIGRLFGGNNLAEMSIMPKWNLQSGLVRNLYSGGNRGAMTCPKGLLLEIPATSTVVVDNLYGGCRMADVEPKVAGRYTPTKNSDLGGSYKFPDEMSARVLVRGGDINNVYGGNDITGRVYGGNAIGIYTRIRGDVYGGGNGAYPYTDNSALKSNEIYGDLYYDPGSSSVDALNAFRPNAEQVSIRLAGTQTKPVIIGGSVYVGGNCATLKPVKEKPLIELKMGSYVIADKVFLGNNGEGMVTYNEEQTDGSGDITQREGTLRTLSSSVDGKKVSQIDLMDKDEFATYMEGVAMDRLPALVFDQEPRDPATYEEYSSYIGSLFCGGNRGSMTYAGTNAMTFDHKLIVYNKLVGGCNNANVAATTYNAAYKGGIIGSAAERTESGGKTAFEGQDRLVLNFNGLKIQPKRFNDVYYAPVANGTTLTSGKTYYTSAVGEGEFTSNGSEEADATHHYFEKKEDYVGAEAGTKLVWNTALWSVDENDFVPTGTTNDADNADRRLLGGNIYGGCYNSGHVNGNVVINIADNVIERYKEGDTDHGVFADVKEDDISAMKPGGERRSGVILDNQAQDVMALAMTVFGGGCGEDTEIWGSTTINHNNGYAFQIFGGGEEGVIGRKNDSGEYVYNTAYSTTVNLSGENEGYSEKDKTKSDPLPESEYLYGGGNEGDVCGDSYVNLGNGRIYGAFGGASNADILGGTEVYIGRQPNHLGGYKDGFPWVRNDVYGGNDFGGTVRGKIDHKADVTRTVEHEDLLESSTFVKYIMGRVDSIFGGNFGSYNYKDRIFKDYTDANGEPLTDGSGNTIFHFPHLDNNSFVYFCPADHPADFVNYVFGGSEGVPGFPQINDKMQEESYVLIDDTETKDADRFASLDVYGGGSFAGLGTEASLGCGRSRVDLFSGSLHNVYGGSNSEGLIGYTHVNVPSESTIKVNAIFGGGKGYDRKMLTATPALKTRYCDNYITCVDYRSNNAIVSDAIYGGNHNCRVSFDTYINVEASINQGNGYQASVYGAGYGDETVTGRTNVFMNNGSDAYKVFGGGRDGNAYNFASIRQWMKNLTPGTEEEKEAAVVAFGGILRSFATYIAGHSIDLPDHILSAFPESKYPNDMMTPPYSYHSTNVHLMQGSNVTGYAYGGGYGQDAVTSGTTYVELKGGNVDRDIYGGGQGGPVMDEFGLKTFTATTNVYVEGGMVRNVYGGGYLGHVGKHDLGNNSDITTAYSDDIPAVANVTIGKADGTSFIDGIPAIMRNAYGGGEGGSVFGTTNLTINNGYIGYRYKNIGTSDSPVYDYVEELDDKTANAIEAAGNAFGGGYVINSYVDIANVNMYGGTIRGSLYGGGEVGPIGRGYKKFADSYSTGLKNGDVRIFKAGKTHVKMYDGHVKRNVFGGGRGQDSWGGDGTLFMTVDKATLDLDASGYVFGQTEVNVFGGEVGTDEGVARGYGNVFGGGDIGFVYSAYEDADGKLCIGKKDGVRYDDGNEGYYYKYEPEGSGYAFATSGSEKVLTEDCKVLVEPWCKAKTATTIHDRSFSAGEYVPTAYLNYLGNKDDAAWTPLSKADKNKDGILIHNAVFAGGNTSPGSTIVYAATTTVYGNATASIHDVYHRDLITVGQGRVGGLYGDGNLTLVDGYRELNITNYGTDYHHLQREITLAEYKDLPFREAAYYEIRYKCVKPCRAYNGRSYTVESTISADELQSLFVVLNNSTNQYESVKDGETAILVWDAKNKLWTPNPNDGSPYWVENGVCSRYAGRLMNTIQRADFCGIWGSRMVMQGARDRVPATVDYTNYTINRVREVSLNKKPSLRSEDSRTEGSDDYWSFTCHGNYFGIYNTVNYLGALTSDLDFGDDGSKSLIGRDVRTSDNADTETYRVDANNKPYGQATFYDWKKQFVDERKRNNGNSWNKVALASGVYLELTTEKSKGKGLYEKDWGIITGVIELDLISVQPGLGGGFVYAKNEHGVRYPTGLTHTTLTALNDGAITRKKFKYNINMTGTDLGEGSKKEWQTSGNFVHSTLTIIDDCYNMGGKYHSNYKQPDGVPAHYWYIKGSVYIYDQYISAYTGSPNAYSEVVNIPLTITSASHGRMTLLEVQPNYYAYYADMSGSSKIGANEEIVLRDVTYKLNDPITYWDYFMLSDAEKKMFVDKTYVVKDSCFINDNYYPAGSVLLPSEYATLETAANSNKHVFEEGEAAVAAVKKATIGSSGQNVVETDKLNNEVLLPFYDVFRESNNLSHNTGYILTYNVDNPKIWSTWYSKTDNTAPMSQTKGTGYEDGPTYRLDPSKLAPGVTGVVLGQQDYIVGNIISKDTYDKYQSIKNDENHSSAIPAGQAKFEPAYIVTAEVLEATNYAGDEQRFYKNATLGKSAYVNTNNSESETSWTDDKERWSAISGSVKRAYVVTSTIQLSETDYIYRGTYMTEDQKTTYYNKYNSGETEEEKQIAKNINDLILPAYYCYGEGKYGGNYYVAGYNYRGLEAFSSMSEGDRSNFTFNYDALDLLIDPNYSYNGATRVYGDGQNGELYQYDGAGNITEDDVDNPPHYSLKTPIDYRATFKATTDYTSVKYIGDDDHEHIATDGTEISRTEYERLLNERYYYSPITIKKENGVYPTYYVVNTSMILGDTPYACGQVIDKKTYDGLTQSEKTRVTALTFKDTAPAGTYYYCRESYTIAKAADEGEGVSASTEVESGGVTAGSPWVPYTSEESNSTVPVGVVIDPGTFENLKNNQKNFVIHGLAPTETSTLYVAADSDIDDLSTEKVITVVYKYDYVETDMAGMSIVPVSERHVLNIHINFRSGIPTIEDIQAPEIVLPGTTVSIKEPYVTPGAYEVTGGGWELFDDEKDAETHVNGIQYTPNMNPLYLYQHNYHVAYYAQTYLGKTYSNSVPVSVANYHDLKKVMDATTHHYHIDHKDIFRELKVEPKIYINDYSGGSEDGLDLFKDLYDLSLLTETSATERGYTVTDGVITATQTPTDPSAPTPNTKLVGQTLLKNYTDQGGNKFNYVPAGKNLEFFLRTDIDHTGEWTPIASKGSDPCFQGTFHGDGHTLSGLDHSLFGRLCGKVYNLGVMGSFTSAGVADTGDGYVENCWINTTETPEDGIYAVFGNPMRSEDDEPIQIVNSYCQEGKTYKTTPDTHGVATAKPQKAFYNGEVAYDLNGFYLYKRYCDKEVSSGAEEQKYQFFTIDSDNKLVLQSKYYGSNPNNCSSGFLPSTLPANYEVPMYVEDRFADGDFRYAAGTIPSEEDERYHSWTYTYTDPTTNETETKEDYSFFPIWPDDYIFFGQMLTYGYGANAHQDVPTAVARMEGRLSQTADANRVYRAPAYFSSKAMDVAHFNPHAFLAQKSVDGTKVAYPHMTAIDFAGHHDAHDDNEAEMPYLLGTNGSWFYQPLLDDDGLQSIRNCDETRNLLVYAPAKTENAKTYGVLTGYFEDPYYDDPDNESYYDNNDGYRLVKEYTGSIYGHVVHSENHLTATTDHLLVDKQDFNCPIAYNFGSGKRMWYQRRPDTCVDKTKGWEAVSIPFTAELVTTQQKGEITHFYEGSNTSSDGTKVGHEYWLRELKGINSDTSSGSEVAVANFTYPDAVGETKRVTNKFLWDYYYSQSYRQDENTDIYQEYYKNPRTYANYPLLSAAKPYLIGFPGETYYEFDLDGKFIPQHTSSAIGGLGKQIITFASNPNITIGVSDDEMAGVEKTLVGDKDYTFTFKPNYLTTTLNTSDSYTLNADGDEYGQVATTATVQPFRPYFTATSASHVKEYKHNIRSIVFTREPAQMYEQEEEDDISNMGDLIIKSQHGRIIVTSTMTKAKDVLIVTAAGAMIDRYTIQPGETVETRVNASGVYIVNKKKLSVKVKD